MDTMGEESPQRGAEQERRQSILWRSRYCFNVCYCSLAVHYCSLAGRYCSLAVSIRSNAVYDCSLACCLYSLAFSPCSLIVSFGSLAISLFSLIVSFCSLAVRYCSLAVSFSLWRGWVTVPWCLLSTDSLPPCVRKRLIMKLLERHHRRFTPPSLHARPTHSEVELVSK